jgi:hypothetical protein
VPKCDRVYWQDPVANRRVQKGVKVDWQGRGEAAGDDGRGGRSLCRAIFDLTIRAELQAAGFQRSGIDTVEQVSQAPSAERVAIGLCQGTPLRGEIEARDRRFGRGHRRRHIALRARVGAGPFENRMSALVVTAHRP